MCRRRRRRAASSVVASFTIVNGPRRAAVVQVRCQLGFRRVGAHSDEHVDAGSAQAIEAAPGHDRIRVLDRDDDARDAGFEQQARARGRAAVVVAGLEGDVGGRSACPFTGCEERRALGVVARPERPGRALADHFAVSRDDATDPRPRRCVAARAGGDPPGLGPSTRRRARCCTSRPQDTGRDASGRRRAPA